VYICRTVQQLGEYDATVGSLQAILDSHRGCQFVNVAKHCNIPAEHAIQQFCSTNNLFWLDPCNGSIDFIYHSDVNGHFSLIDHFMCSKLLVDNIQKTTILAHGNNNSDHLLSQCAGVDNRCLRAQRPLSCTGTADLSHYQAICSDRLSQISLPVSALLCTCNGCNEHFSDLENYYCEITQCLAAAAHDCIPQWKAGVQKHWWTPELSDLKQQCIEQTDVWRTHGCPRSGMVNDPRIKNKLKYKCAIKAAILSAEEEFNDNLVDRLCNKDFNNFWKKFCSKNLKPTARLNNRTSDANILDEFSNHFRGVHQPNTEGADDKYKAFVAEFLKSNDNIGSQANTPVINFTTVQERIDMHCLTLRNQ